MEDEQGLSARYSNLTARSFNLRRGRGVAGLEAPEAPEAPAASRVQPSFVVARVYGGEE